MRNDDEKDHERDRRSDEDYRVGNKRPPRHSQFKPGVSGNPEGRRKGSVNLRTRVQRGLRKTVVVSKNGWPTRMVVAEVISNRLLEFVDEGRS